MIDADKIFIHQYPFFNLQTITAEKIKSIRRKLDEVSFTRMDFFKAIEHVKQGKCLRRDIWGEGVYIQMGEDRIVLHGTSCNQYDAQKDFDDYIKGIEDWSICNSMVIEELEKELTLTNKEIIQVEEAIARLEEKMQGFHEDRDYLLEEIKKLEGTL